MNVYKYYIGYPLYIFIRCKLIDPRKRKVDIWISFVEANVTNTPSPYFNIYNKNYISKLAT